VDDGVDGLAELPDGPRLGGPASIARGRHPMSVSAETPWVSNRRCAQDSGMPADCCSSPAAHGVPGRVAARRRTPMSTETIAARRSRLEQLAVHPYTPAHVKERIERVLGR